MSHRSRLCTFVIDCRTDDLPGAAEFWGKALGKPVVPVEDEPSYIELKTADDEPFLLLQKVEHEPRIHLDIESDDLDAEAERLVALGAKKVAFVKRWWVMEAPTGHRFCIVRRQRDEFGPHLNEWD